MYNFQFWNYYTNNLPNVARVSGCRHSPACSPRIRLVAKEEAVALLAHRLTRWPRGNASAPIARTHRSLARKGTGARHRTPGQVHTGHGSPTELARSITWHERTSGGTPNQRSPLTYIVSLSPGQSTSLSTSTPVSKPNMLPRLSGIDGNKISIWSIQRCHFLAYAYLKKN